jgi:FLVCR family feline leukemia virus subgroup C receptor-related protein
MGIAFSFLMPTWYFMNSSIELSDFKQVIQSYTFTGAVITICSCVPSIVLMKANPNIPPSLSQQIKKDYNYSFISSLSKLFKNKNFVLLLISFSCIYGFYFYFNITINSLYSLYTIDTTTISYLVAVLTCTGLISSLVFSYLVDRVRKYKIFCIILNIILITAFAGLAVFLEIYIERDNIFIVYIGSGVLGACLMPLYSISLDYSSELTYPVGESLCIGILISFGQVIGLASSFILDYFIHKESDKKYLSNIYTGVLFLVSLICLIFMNGNI